MGRFRRWPSFAAIALLASLGAASPAFAAWNAITDDNFSHANTSTGSANSTTGVPTQGGWTDVQGGVWNIQSDEAQGVAEGSSSWSRDFLLAPNGYANLDQRIVVTMDTAASGCSNSEAGDGPWPILRYIGSGKGYTVDMAPTATQIYYLAGGGSATTIGSVHSWTYTSGHTYTFDFSATGASPTTLTIVITDVTASSTLVNYSTTDSTSGVQVAGQYAMDVDTGCTTKVAHATTYGDQTMAVSPTSVSASSTGNSLTLTGTGTNWTSGTPGAPTFTASCGTITAQTVASTTSATLTYSAPGSTGTCTLTDPSTGATASLTIGSGSSATDFTFTPSSQTTPDGVATGNFTITPNGTPSSSTNVALSDGGASGTFTPSSPLTFTTSTAQTFTYTPASAAVTPITLTATASGGFSASHTVTVNTTSKIAVNDSNWFWSPYTWYVNGSTSALSQDWGAYFKIGFTGTSVAVTFDVSALTGASVSSSQYPYIRYTIDSGVFATYQLTSSTTSVTLASGLGSGTHSLVLTYYGATFANDFWTTPVMAVKITQITVDGGSASAAPTLLSKRCLFYGDSITQGHHVLANDSLTPPHDAMLAYSASAAAGMGCEYGNIGYGSTGWTTSAQNVPPIFTSGNDTNSSWDKYFAGQSRLVSSALSPAPNYIFINEGTNDSGASSGTVETQEEGLLAALRAAAPSAWIFLETPFNGIQASALTTGFNTYQTSTPDAKAKLINLGVTAAFSSSFDCTVNGVTGTFAAPLDCWHPAYWYTPKLGAMVAQAAQANLGGTPGVIVGTLMAPW